MDDVQYKYMTVKKAGDGKENGGNGESHDIAKSLRYALLVPEDELVQITPKLRAMRRLDDMDLKDFILYMEMVAEVKSRLEGLSASNIDAVAIPLRKDKIQLLLPEEIISIPLEKLFTENDKEGAYRNHRLDVFRDLSAAGCFKDPESLLQNSEAVMLSRTSINEQNFRPLYEVVLKRYHSKAQEMKRLLKPEDEDHYKTDSRRKSLKSLNLVAEINPSKVIFLVLDKHFEAPIRCEIKNPDGTDTYIKKLHNIAYSWGDARGKRVPYDKNLADSINNKLFRLSRVRKYMKTNELETPTLVRKSSDGTLVLENESTVKTTLLKEVPPQYQSLYVDKTN